jgi:uncharacterized damage-inducible protein DinB
MMIRVLGVAAIAAATMFAQQAAIQEVPLSQEDKDFLVIKLLESRQKFFESLKGVSKEQFKFKAADDRWSIADVCEHLTKTEDLFGSMMQRQIIPMKPNAEKRMGRTEDVAVWNRITDRGQKATAPEPLRPEHMYSDPLMVPNVFTEKRNRTVIFVWTTTEDLRARYLAQQKMDAYQMLVLLAAHTERHTAQIEEVKKDPKYPK